MKGALQKQSANLSRSLSGCLREVATEMYAKELITKSVHQNPTYISLINDFENEMVFKDISGLENHCQLFLDSLSSQRGPVKSAAKVIAENWKSEISNELKITLTLNVY